MSTAQRAVPGDVLVVDRLVRRFGDLTAVDGVSFRIDAGETYGLLGPNGAGKTTTISMVAGLIARGRGDGHRRRRADGPRRPCRRSGTSASCPRTSPSTPS